MTHPTAHTPTPWTARNQMIRDSAGAQIGMTTGYRGDGMGAANAALIVRAVNSHAPLVAALEYALAELDRAIEASGYVQVHRTSLIVARMHSALREAKGGA